MTLSVDTLNELLACPRCTASCFVLREGMVSCAYCGAAFAVSDGVVDFVAGSQTTYLDSVDYDRFYSVEDAGIEQAFDAVRAETGTLFEERLENVLEVGAGTGRFTAGLFAHASIGRLVATDLSPKMLAQCRARLGGVHSPPSPPVVVFATNDGENLGAARGRYDLVVGHFALHHVLYYERTLKAAFEATMPAGRAVFIEPGRKFYFALWLAMLRVIERMLRGPSGFVDGEGNRLAPRVALGRLLARLVRAPSSAAGLARKLGVAASLSFSSVVERLLRNAPSWTEAELHALLSLHREWHFNLKYADVPEFLAKSEDKHLFDRRRFERSARRAGWPSAVTIPFVKSHAPLAVAEIYAKQIPFSDAGRRYFLDAMAGELPGAFELLDDADAAPSYVFVLSKDPSKLGEPLREDEGAELLAHKAPALGEVDAELLYDLALTMHPREGEVEARVDGWVVAKRSVMRLLIRSQSRELAVPVCEPRADVYETFRASGVYSADKLLYSGVASVTRYPSEAESPLSGAFRVSVELAGGERHELAGRCRLKAGLDGVRRHALTAMR